ncbi:MAG: hypothetical protein IKU82_03225 [Clostridia bacterium]|nr:hypothetical protein [Clostridia bacterium]
MKNYKEITESLFKRRDEYVKQRKIKTKRIIVTSISFCLILIICATAWQFDLYKTPPIDTPSESTVSSQKNESNNDTQNEVVSEPTDSKSPIEQSAKDIPTEIGGAEGWWYDAVYEFKYNEESKSYIDLIVGKEPSDSWYNQFWLANKETYTRIENVGIIGAIDEFGINKEQFVTVIQEQGLIVDGRYYSSPYYIGNTPIDDSFEAYERYWYLTQEEVDLIFLEDRELRDQKCRSRYTAFANGKIYTPLWICSHTAEDYIAAGLTKQQMIETISTWNNVGVPIVVEYDGEVWCDAERFKQVLEFVKIEIDKMP